MGTDNFVSARTPLWDDPNSLFDQPIPGAQVTLLAGGRVYTQNESGWASNHDGDPIRHGDQIVVSYFNVPASYYFSHWAYSGGATSEISESNPVESGNSITFTYPYDYHNVGLHVIPRFTTTPPEQKYRLWYYVIGSDYGRVTGPDGSKRGNTYWYIEIPEGQAISLVAYPDSQKEISRWSSSDDSSGSSYSTVNGTNGTYNFNMPSRNHSIGVEFKPTISLPPPPPPELPPPEIFCLTVYVVNSSGTVTHPKFPNDPATSSNGGRSADVDSGDVVSLTATPPLGDWDVSWAFDPSVSSLKSPDNNTCTFDMPSVDLSVYVTFSQEEVAVSLSVGAGTGCIELESPSPSIPTPCAGGSYSIDPNTNGSIRVRSAPASGWEVSEWKVNGASYSSSSYLDVDITDGISKDIKVYYSLITSCDTKTLTVSIPEQGSGFVTPPAGEYCDDLTLTLTPKSLPGYRFKEWVYTDTAITSSGFNQILVPMNVNRSVTAIFESISEFEDTCGTNGVLFYCSSETYKDNVISFDFINDLNNQNPSDLNLFHFRVNFYSDIDKTKLVYSAFSLADNKRWFLDDGSFNQLSIDGLNVGQNETVSIVYDPEVLPSQVTETQKSHLINNNVIYEKPLICGVKYYVEIQSYERYSNNIVDIKTIIFILACNRVDSYYWNYNKDNNKWLCSGQGKMDLKVADGFNQSVNSSISSNKFGIYQIVWQGRRSQGNNIYGAKWDSNNDFLYSSGQGLYNTLELTSSNSPIILSDPLNNFYITSQNRDEIKYKACGIKICEEDECGGYSSSTTTAGSVSRVCYPGELTLLNNTYDQIKMRVYPEDISGSLVINNDKVVPVINKISIRIDIDGIVGGYAVRLRNIEDEGWGEWLNIDGELFGEVGIDSGSFRIDNSRFIVPWDIERNNGLRRICCQVLTMYGISNTFCLDILANFDVPQHVFKFYTDSARQNEFLKYNGQYVLSVANSPAPNNDSATVYFSVIFSEETSYTTDLKFNVVQQGINDIRKQALVPVGDNKTFDGSFLIYNDDGIFNKDGRAFIEIVLPGGTGSCGIDSTDKYNLVNNDEEQIALIDLSPEESYDRYQANQLSKALDLNEFKQYYDKDDTNFKFGNPGYFRK